MKKIIFIICCAFLTASCVIDSPITSNENPLIVEKVIHSNNTKSTGKINTDTHTVTIIYGVSNSHNEYEYFKVGDTLLITSRRYIRELELKAND